MDSPLFNIDIPGMQVTVNSYKPGSGLIWGTLFPLKYTPKFDLKGIEGNEGIPVAADRVAFNTKAPLKTRKTVGTWSGKLGKISVSRPKNETDINEYNDLQAIAAANTEDKATAQYLVDMVYNDIDFCNDAMNYRVEVDACRIASKAKQTYNSKIDGDTATEDVIDFKVPEKHKVGVVNKWSDAEHADGLKDIGDLYKKIKKEGSAAPRYCYITQDKFEELCAQKSVARRLFPQVTDLSVVTADMITLTSINNYMSRQKWPQLLVIDPYVTIEHKDGSQETIQPWNNNVVTLSPTIQLGWTYWKQVPLVKNTAALQVYGSFYKLTVYSEQNPMSETTMAEAYVQPGLINRASLGFINTDNTVWADGESAA